MNNGTAIKVRGIDANGNSITTTPKGGSKVRRMAVHSLWQVLLMVNGIE